MISDEKIGNFPNFIDMKTIILSLHCTFCQKEQIESGVGIQDRVPGIPQSRSRSLGPELILKSRTGTGTEILKIRDLGLGPELRFAGRGIPGLNFGGLSRGPKIFRDTVPVPCRPLD